MAQPDFTADITEGCTPLHVKFSIVPSTVDMDTIDRIDWHFGFGDSITAINPDTQIYENEGLYTVVMVINGFRESAVIKTDYINVHRTLLSVFRYEEYATGNNFRFIPLDIITDPSATYFYMWRYHKLTGTDDRSHDYIVNISNKEIAIDSVTLDTGSYEVLLRIEDDYGCLSQYSTLVSVLETIQIPNVFLPEVEEFLIINPLNLRTILKFQVYNRYGLLVFSQTSPIINWDGKSNSGQDLNTGVYYYTLDVIEGDPAGRFEQQGFIHLYR
jgi:PKD repeat protein